MEVSMQDRDAPKTTGRWEGYAVALLLFTLLVLLGVKRLQQRPPSPLSPSTHPPAPQAPPAIDLNRAEEAQLVLLPGIGPEKARRIAAHRARNGPFRNLDEIADIPGIGPGTIEGLRPYVVLTQSSSQ
jgi:competence ComEA-like helix-hairpin-helix protein